MRSRSESGCVKQVILRVDDIHGGTQPDQLFQLYRDCWGRGIPVCFAVVPDSAAQGSPFGRQLEWGQNPALGRLLADLYGSGLIEILLHGWRHLPGELAGQDQAAIRGRLEAGLARLHNVWPDIPIGVLVPPHDHLSAAGLQAARELGLEICSSWAACHGGTRRAHWWGRLRGWLGRPFGQAGAGLWPTDIDLLDLSKERDDPKDTARLLRSAARQQTPVVFVQHYWRIADSPERLRRWRVWLSWMADQPDVAFTRFCDV